MNVETSRRKFLKSSLASSAALAFSGAQTQAAPHSNPIGANDDIRVAVIGVGSNVQVGGRGKVHIREFSALLGARVVAICDPDRDILSKQAREFAKQSEKVDTYTDLRKLLEDKDIDAISVTTPNHWHALATIWGCQAGKDVYVEKPVSNTLWEGRKMVEAARKYNRIVQSGLGNRADVGLQEAIAYIKEGQLGKLKVARGICYRRRRSIGKVSGPQSVPDSVDYDLWSGPAPMDPIMRKNFHYDWHWFWPTGAGDLGNMGIHMMDVCRWVLGHDTLPEKVVSIGGRFDWDDDGQTPNTQVVAYDYKPVPLLFEVRAFAEEKGSDERTTYRNLRVGIVFECEDGYLMGEGGGGRNTAAYDYSGKVIRTFEGEGNNYANFLDVLRSRRVSDQHAEILDGHLSTALVHMGNISHRVGREKNPLEIRRALETDKGALEAFNRFQDHLDKNEVDLAKTPTTLGPVLEMDPVSERFVGGEGLARANELLTREYRAPFTISESV